MTNLTIDISEKSHRILQQLAAQRSQSIQEIIDEALEYYRRRRLLESANEAFAAMREDPEAWKAEQEERAEWDATLSDGLEDS